MELQAVNYSTNNGTHAGFSIKSWSPNVDQTRHCFPPLQPYTLEMCTHCLTATMRGHHSSKAWGYWLLAHHVGVHTLLIHHSIGWHAHSHAIHLQARLKETCMLWLISWVPQVY